MNKLYINFFVLLMLSLTGGAVLADTGRFGGGFFGFGKNNVEGAESSHKELQHVKQVEKSTGRNKEIRVEIANQESGKNLNRRNAENSNAAVKKNRLTPEERRALRRQIQDASNELHTPSK